MNNNFRCGMFFLLLLSTYMCSLAQTIYNAETSLDASRFSRPVGMGSSYTGVADGIETIYYNNAGLSNLNYYSLMYSNGFGNYYISDYNVFDIAVGIPINLDLGSTAISFHQLNFSDDVIKTNISLHYGLHVMQDFSVGAALNYYRNHMRYIRVEENGRQTQIDTAYNAMDFSLSALYDFQNILNSSWANTLRCGIHLDNVLGSALSSFQGTPIYEYRLVQTARLGASMKVIPPVQKYHDLNPVSFLIACEIDLRNDIKAERYSFDSYTPNFGFEVQVFDMVSFRYGRENYVKMRGDRIYTYQYPLSRIGIGVRIPIHKFINRDKNLILVGDYSTGIWYHQGILDDWTYSQKSRPQKSVYGISLLTQF